MKLHFTQKAICGQHGPLAFGHWYEVRDSLHGRGIARPVFSEGTDNALMVIHEDDPDQGYSAPLDCRLCLDPSCGITIVRDITDEVTITVGHEEERNRA